MSLYIVGGRSQSGQLPDGTEVGLKGAYISAGLCCCCCWRLLLLGSSVLAGDGGICEAEEYRNTHGCHNYQSHLKVTLLQVTVVQSEVSGV